MKTFHYINFVIIILILIGICVAEEFVVSDSLKLAQKECYSVEATLDKNEDLKNMEIVMLVENLEYDWKKNESKMCYLVNHKSIQEIGQEIARLKLYIKANDLDEFRVSLELIKSYCHSYLHFMGANIHNVL